MPWMWRLDWMLASSEADGRAHDGYASWFLAYPLNVLRMNACRVTVLLVNAGRIFSNLQGVWHGRSL